MTKRRKKKSGEGVTPPDPTRSDAASSGRVVWSHYNRSSSGVVSQGSVKVASASGCGMVFFGLVAVVTGLITIQIAWMMIYPDLDVEARFVETSGEVLGVRVREVMRHDAATYFPEARIRFTPAGEEPRELWGYDVPPREASSHASAWESVDRHPTGERLQVWYDPQDPRQFTIAHAKNARRWIVILIPLGMLSLAVYGLGQCWRLRGLSPEASARKLKDPAIHFILLGSGGIVTLMGLALLSSMIFEKVLPEHRAAHSYASTEGTVVDSRVVSRKASKRTDYRPEFLVEYQSPAFADPVQIWCYRATEPALQLNEAQALLASFPKGSRRTVYYDPDYPRYVVLDPSMNPARYLLLLVPVLLLGPGLLMTYYAVRLGRPDAGNDTQSFVESGEASGLARRAFPKIRRAQPGERLAWRLTERGSLWREFWFMVFFSLGWNVVAGAFAAAAIANRAKGRPEWFLTIFSGFLVLIGLLLVWGMIARLLAAMRVPAAFLEFSAWPLALGQTCQFHVHQGGRRPLESLVVRLECHESASYSVGTNRRTEQERVFLYEIVRRNAAELAGQMPFAADSAFTIPADKMPSFEGSTNSVLWKITVVSQFQGGEKIETELPAPVTPASVRGT